MSMSSVSNAPVVVAVNGAVASRSVAQVTARQQLGPCSTPGPLASTVSHHLPTALAAACMAAAAAANRASGAGSRGTRRTRRAGRGGAITLKAAEPYRNATEIDLSRDIAERPQRKMAKELAKYEDPDDPLRPAGLPRPREGKWAPPLPEPKAAPEALVVGIGRQLRESEAQGPRARLGAAAVEALQQRFGVTTYYDADVRGYVGTCRASLDKSGYAGVQKINMLQPVVERDNDVASAIYKTMQEPGMDKAMILLVMADWRLPFGQIRLRVGYDDDDDRVRLAYNALNPYNQVNVLHIGCGNAAANEELLPAEIGALPRVLANAASAIEIWLSEADIGLVMRFVNRPDVYEMPPGWPYAEAALPAADEPVAQLEAAAEALPASTSSSSTATPKNAEESPALDATQNQGAFLAPIPDNDRDYMGFTLFDVNRDDQSAPPRLSLAPLSPESALATLQERPAQCEALRLAGRNHISLATLERDVGTLLTKHGPGQHLRMENDEDTIKALLSYHPDADRLLEDIVAVKVDCSPVDDDTRCLWVIKFDGFEEDVSMKEFLRGLQSWVQLHPEDDRASGAMKRLGVGRWTKGLRESTYERAVNQEQLALAANGDNQKKFSPTPGW